MVKDNHQYLDQFPDRIFPFSMQLPEGCKMPRSIKYKFNDNMLYATFKFIPNKYISDVMFPNWCAIISSLKKEASGITINDEFEMLS